MPAKSIMIQGTMSNAGKSVLAAGLCRIFRQDGYKVAPFKSQNMALNSFITAQGLEMGRAQVMQAEAAGVEPSVEMNPILLKPTSDVGSQVIVNGRAVGNLTASEYFRQKSRLIPQVMEAYHTLEEQYDIIVLGGGGKPAEINLKSKDIVNMGLARMVGAPVLLAGDIDRGGVFAALYGTMALLEAEERPYVKGTIINKFRGDVELLRPGLMQLEELCKVPVVGVVPWMELDLDEEDSLSFRLGAQGGKAPLDVAVIRLPRISNFTDFDPLQRHPAVGLRYVDRAEELGRPDLVILPGTKSTLADLRWLRQCGLEAAILKLASRGTPVMGICGGYQMLGRKLSDPLGVEGGGSMDGHGPSEYHYGLFTGKNHHPYGLSLPGVPWAVRVTLRLSFGGVRDPHGPERGALYGVRFGAGHLPPRTAGFPPAGGAACMPADGGKGAPLERGGPQGNPVEL